MVSTQCLCSLTWPFKLSPTSGKGRITYQLVFSFTVLVFVRSVWTFRTPFSVLWEKPTSDDVQTWFFQHCLEFMCENLYSFIRFKHFIESLTWGNLWVIHNFCSTDCALENLSIRLLKAGKFSWPLQGKQWASLRLYDVNMNPFDINSDWNRSCSVLVQG